MLKSFFRYIIYSVFPRFAFSRSVSSYRKQVKLLREKKTKLNFEGEFFNVEELRKKKQSDTLFIIGSAHTVEDLTDSEWGVISTHDSLSLNFNLIMDHAPTFYMFETPSDSERRNIFFDWLRKRSDYYNEKGVAILVRSFESQDLGEGDIPKELESQCYIQEQFKIIAPTKRSLRKSISYFCDFSIRNKFCVPTYKASLFTACYFGHMMGYKKIVLVGFELTDLRYFYNNEKYAGVHVPSTGQVGEIHKTAVRNDLSISIADALFVLDQHFFKPAGVRLFITSRKSLLSKYLDFQAIDGLR